MRVLLVGSGGREHAIAWKLLLSPSLEKLFWAPGNGGAGPRAETVEVAAEDVDGLVKFSLREKMDLVVVGPEAPLSKGLVDELEKAGVKAFGPSAAAARLECSKIFTKEFCKRHSIPSAAFETFTDPAEATAYVSDPRTLFPLVLKADGLAAGKGVIIAADRDEAISAVSKIMVEKEFGTAGDKLLVEEFLTGEEASLMAICDGRKSVLLPPARDFKRALDRDRGLNTGGMGALCPTAALGEADLAAIKETIIDRTVERMAAEGSPFKGVLYAGLMLTASGPKLLEFNARFGDPETQVVLPMIEEDLLPLLAASAEGSLPDRPLRISPKRCVTVVATSKGYPGSYARGFEILGLEEAEREGAFVFHAGTRREGGKVLTAGGRVLNVTALGGTIEEARDRAYRAMSYLKFEGLTYRSDIALK